MLPYQPTMKKGNGRESAIRRHAQDTRVEVLPRAKKTARLALRRTFEIRLSCLSLNIEDAARVEPGGVVSPSCWDAAMYATVAQQVARQPYNGVRSGPTYA